MKKNVTLSIKNVPVEIVELLKQRAAANHRSLQGELMATIEAAAYRQSVSPNDLLHIVRESLSQSNSSTDESQQQAINNRQDS